MTADIEDRGPGGRYLVWHSAGSGKTKTIAWLAHRLSRHMNASGTATFDSVIVVSDRQVLDDNIVRDIEKVEASKDLVVSVSAKLGAKSPQLKRALLEGNHIVTCTLQTFPEVMKLIEDTSELQGRRWAVIADEAHSSQTGSAARDLKALLAEQGDSGDDDDALSADDLLAAKDSAIAGSANITFVALTATPKAKTLRLFGHESEGRWEAFDTYTMAQAIEEGFILDVLRNYTTYDMFVRVRDAVAGAGDREVSIAEAVQDIVQFTRMHETTIAQKVQVVVEHFRRNVMHHLGGQARAMVVTNWRVNAVQWSREIDKYLEEKGYHDIHTLVAFSGTVAYAGQDWTETGMNQTSDTERAFKDEDFQVLIVANKYQTGFDEPRLWAMYVDKELHGIATVQTLSRLNRMHPGKPLPMVLDFRNTPESVVADFARYYTDAHVANDVDPNALFDLATQLDTFGIYSHDEMVELSDAYLADRKGEELRRLIGQLTERWYEAKRQAILAIDKAALDEVLLFRANAIAYEHAWEFLSQVVDFRDPDLHRRAIVANIFGRNLKLGPAESGEDYAEAVELAGVQLVPSRIAEDHGLTQGNEDPLVLPAFTAGFGGQGPAPAQGPLSEAIQQVNDLFSANGTHVSTSATAGFLTAAWGILSVQPDVRDMAQANTVEQLANSTAFSDKAVLALIQQFSENEDIQKALADPSIMAKVVALLAQLVHADAQAKKLEETD